MLSECRNSPLGVQRNLGLFVNVAADLPGFCSDGNPKCARNVDFDGGNMEKDGEEGGGGRGRGGGFEPGKSLHNHSRTLAERSPPYDGAQARLVGRQPAGENF